MVLESLTTPLKSVQHPYQLFLVGFIYATVGIFLSYWVFRAQAGIVMVLFIVLMSVPLFYQTMKREESQVMKYAKEKDILHAHAQVVRFFVFFFIGLTVAFALWFIVLPNEVVINVYSIQAQTISSLNQQVTGGAAEIGLFSRIFFNNMKVLIFSLLFSFLFGSGAIFILAWNASVIGTAMGSFFTSTLPILLHKSINEAGAYLIAGALSLLRYFLHGIPEILAYFVGGIAGGILSVAIINKDVLKRTDRILTDFSDLLLIALLFLLVAGLLEVFVTPLFF
ncbi:hypothetical protein GF342_01640 [Candidatus Woesearchaeota archaeon]|nr:hypothetical protein [Candidatus Woesearchaeota archaeon]